MVLKFYVPQKLQKNKIFRRGLFNCGGTYNTTRVCVKKNKFIFFITCAESGIVNRQHLVTAGQLVQRGLRFNRCAGRQNMFKYCCLYLKLLNISATKKSAGIRMGKGKGEISYWALKLRGGERLFSFNHGINKFSLLRMFKQLQYKFPVRLRLICRDTDYC